MDVHLYMENIPWNVVLVRSGVIKSSLRLTSCMDSSCCWNDQKPEISAWDLIHTSEELHMPSWFLERETLWFLQRKEREFELSAVSLSWVEKCLCQVCVLYLHFLCFPLSLNPGLLGDAGTFCDPVPEASFCRVGINRGTPVGHCTLSKTHPAKPLPTLLPRQCPLHLIRMALDRLHYSEKCTYAFTVQMGLLEFLEEKSMDEGVFIAVQQCFKICLAVLLGAWPQLMQDHPEQQHCSQLVEQIADMLSSSTKGIVERCKSTSPPTTRAPSNGEKKNRKRGQRGCEARWTK